MRKIFLFVAIFAVVMIGAASFVLADNVTPIEGLVPKGCQLGCPCTLCDLYMLGKNIISFLLYGIAIPVVAVVILYGGVMMLTSAGNPQKISTGKTAIGNAIVGLAIAFFAWVIINALLQTLAFQISFGGALTNWNNPPNCTQSAEGDNRCNLEIPKVTGEGGTPNPTNPPNPLGADNTTWTSLQNAMGTNSAQCPEGTGAACIARNMGCDEATNTGTCLGGLNPSSIQGLEELQAACNCKLTINGGSEIGGPGGTHSGSGPGSHVGGDKIDYAPTPDLTAYILNHTTPAGTRSDGAPLYKQGNIVYANEGNHWDVCYANC
jgi:hypothetical protein